MRKLTIQEIIKLLPIDIATKMKLVQDYDTYDPETKSELIQICYGAFFELEQAIKDSIHMQYMEEIAAGTREASDHLFDDVNKAAWEEIEARIRGKQEEQDELSDVRKQLESIIGATQQ